MIEVPASVARVTLDGGVCCKQYYRQAYSKFGITLPAESLFLNEVSALLAVRGFLGLQRMLSYEPKTLTIWSENACLSGGVPIRVIGRSLKQACVIHRDITAKNLVKGKNGWTLVDFQWACIQVPEHLRLSDDEQLKVAAREIGG